MPRSSLPKKPANKNKKHKKSMMKKSRKWRIPSWRIYERQWRRWKWKMRRWGGSRSRFIGRSWRLVCWRVPKELEEGWCQQVKIVRVPVLWCRLTGIAKASEPETKGISEKVEWGWKCAQYTAAWSGNGTCCMGCRRRSRNWYSDGGGHWSLAAAAFIKAEQCEQLTGSKNGGGGTRWLKCTRRR